MKRCIEHQQDRIKGNLESCGATKHTKQYHEKFNWIDPRSMVIMSNIYKTKVRETLEINRFKTLDETDKTFKVLNRDNGDYVTTNS